MEDKLLELLKCDAQEMSLSFTKASIEGAGTPQEVADRREGVVQSFLRKYFPFPYRIVKGNIIDSNGTASNSIDCIVLSPSHPYTIDPKNEKASIIFADGVDAAVEVKPDLSRETELYRALIQIQSVKKLKRKRSGYLKMVGGRKEEADVSFRIPTFIFANKTYSDVRMLIQNIVDFYITNNVPLIEQFDFIIINESMILINIYYPNYTQHGSNYGIFFAETKENTLAAFLFWLNRVPKSEIAIGKTVLEFYLDESLFNARWQTFQDLNELKKTHDNSILSLPPNTVPK